MPKPIHPWPALYATIHPRLVEIARERGYALALHGSLDRDLDVIAVPWIESAGSPPELAEAIRAGVGGYFKTEFPQPELRPFGRICWSIAVGGGAYVDLSIFAPRLA